MLTLDSVTISALECMPAVDAATVLGASHAGQSAELLQPSSGRFWSVTVLSSIYTAQVHMAIVVFVRSGCTFPFWH